MTVRTGCADMELRCYQEDGRGHCGAESEACAMVSCRDTLSLPSGLHSSQDRKPRSSGCGQVTTMSSASDQQWLECGADQSLRSCAVSCHDTAGIWVAFFQCAVADRTWAGWLTTRWSGRAPASAAAAPNLSALRVSRTILVGNPIS